MIETRRKSMTGPKNVLLSIGMAMVLALLAAGCSPENNEIRTGNVRIVEGGERFPLEIPPEFKYPGAEMVLSSTFEGSSFWTRPETTASLRTGDSLNAVANYYRQTVEHSGWTIIQSKNTPEAVLLMAESGYKNLLTIIVRPELADPGKGRKNGQERVMDSGRNPDSDPSMDPRADAPEGETSGPTVIKLYLKQSGAD